MTRSHLIGPTFENLLQGLLGQLRKAAAEYERLGRPQSELLAERLAPDMFPLGKQVETCCMITGFMADRLLGRQQREVETVTSLEQAERQLDQAVARLRNDLADLDAVASDHEVQFTLKPPEGPTVRMPVAEYLIEWALPQIYFHASMAYAIMRKAGVPLGKADYVGHILRHRIGA